MKLRRNLSLLLTILLSLLVTSCRTPPDVAVCTEITPDRGHCTYTISEKSFEVDDVNLLEGKTWWEIRPEMIQVPPKSWAEIKKYIIKQCRLTRKCRGDVGEWLKGLEKRVNE